VEGEILELMKVTEPKETEEKLPVILHQWRPQ